MHFYDTYMSQFKLLYYITVRIVKTFFYISGVFTDVSFDNDLNILFYIECRARTFQSKNSQREHLSSKRKFVTGNLSFDVLRVSYSSSNSIHDDRKRNISESRRAKKSGRGMTKHRCHHFASRLRTRDSSSISVTSKCNDQ